MKLHKKNWQRCMSETVRDLTLIAFWRRIEQISCWKCNKGCEGRTKGLWTSGGKLIQKNSEGALRIYRRDDRSKYFAMELSVVTLLVLREVIYTGRFIMFSVITNIYNKKTKGPTLMKFFTATGKLKNVLLTNRDVRCVHHGWHVTWHTSIRYSSSCHTRVSMLTRVWQELEYRIDVCCVTRGVHIERL